MARSTGKPSAEDGFRPFADDAAVRSIGALCFENGTGRIAIHGSLDLTRDRAGLEQARALKATLDAIVEALRAQADSPEADLPETVAEEPVEAGRSVRNPFA